MFHLPKSVLCLLLLGVFQFSSFEAKALPPASTAVYEWRPELGGVLDTSTNLVWGYSLRNSMNQNAGFTGANTYVPANYAVMLAGESVKSILKDWQSDPVRTKLRHIDLLQIALDKPIVGTVTVTLVGESPGAKIGGALNQVVHHVRVQAIPAELPDHLTVDISGLEVGGLLRISDIAAPKGATILDDPEAIVVTVAATRQTAGDDWRGGDESDDDATATATAAAPDATE